MESAKAHAASSEEHSALRKERNARRDARVSCPRGFEEKIKFLKKRGHNQSILSRGEPLFPLFFPSFFVFFPQTRRSRNAALGRVSQPALRKVEQHLAHGHARRHLAHLPARPRTHQTGFHWSFPFSLFWKKEDETTESDVLLPERKIEGSRRVVVWKTRA